VNNWGLTSEKARKPDSPDAEKNITATHSLSTVHGTPESTVKQQHYTTGSALPQGNTAPLFHRFHHFLYFFVA
jgi:hypothetical protein